MSQERHIEAKVGLLVLICIGLLVAFLVILSGSSKRGSERIYLDLKSLGALKTGAPVKIAGVLSGEVSEITYLGQQNASEPPVFVRVSLDIEKAKLDTLPQDSRFFISSQGILGEKYVEIHPSSSKLKALQSGDIVRGKSGLEIEEVASQASQILSSANDFMQNNEAHINQIVKNADEAIGTLNGTLKKIDAWVDEARPNLSTVIEKAGHIEDAALKALGSVNHALGDGSEVKAILGHTRALTKSAQDSIEPLKTQIQETLGRFTSVGEEAERILVDSKGELASILQAVKGLLMDLREGDGTISSLLNDRELYDDIREMMTDLKRHPWKFIWKE